MKRLGMSEVFKFIKKFQMRDMSFIGEGLGELAVGTALLDINVGQGYY